MTTKKRSTLMEADPASPSTSDLRALFNGRVIAPDDPRYEKARAVFAGNIEHHLAAKPLQLTSNSKDKTL